VDDWPAGRLALRRPADGAVAGLVDAYDVVLTLGQEVAGSNPASSTTFDSTTADCDALLKM